MTAIYGPEPADLPPFPEELQQLLQDSALDSPTSNVISLHKHQWNTSQPLTFRALKTHTSNMSGTAKQDAFASTYPRPAWLDLYTPSEHSTFDMDAQSDLLGHDPLPLGPDLTMPNDVADYLVRPRSDHSQFALAQTPSFGHLSLGGGMNSFHTTTSPQYPEPDGGNTLYHPASSNAYACHPGISNSNNPAYSYWNQATNMTSPFMLESRLAGVGRTFETAQPDLVSEGMSIAATEPKKPRKSTRRRPQEPSKLKGQVHPGMNYFDSATDEMKRRRNQRKDDSVLIKLKSKSEAISEIEYVFDADFQFQRSQKVGMESPVLQTASPVMARTGKRQALANRNTNSLQPIGDPGSTDADAGAVPRYRSAPAVRRSFAVFDERLQPPAAESSSGLSTLTAGFRFGSHVATMPHVASHVTFDRPSASLNTLLPSSTPDEALRHRSPTQSLSAMRRTFAQRHTSSSTFETSLQYAPHDLSVRGQHDDPLGGRFQSNSDEIYNKASVESDLTRALNHHGYLD